MWSGNPVRFTPGAVVRRVVGGAAAVLTVAAVVLVGVPAGAGAPFEPSPWVAQAEGGAELTVGVDGALWSVERTDPVVLRRTTPDGATTSVPLTVAGRVHDLAPGIGGDAVWVSLDDRIVRVSAAGAATIVTLSAGAIDTSLEPSSTGDRMYLVAALAEGSMWLAGVVDTDGDVTLRQFPGAGSGAPGELVAGPQGTRWFAGTTEDGATLSRLEDDLRTTSVRLRGPGTGPTLGPDGLLWVATNGPAGPAVDRLRADGSLASSVALPAAGGPAALGPDGAAYFSVRRGYLRVDAAGEVRPVLEADDSVARGRPLESVAFAGDLFSVDDLGVGAWRLDLDGRAFPVVTATETGRSRPGATTTITVTVAGASSTPTGTVAVVRVFCCHHGMAGAQRSEEVPLGPDGRAQLTLPLDSFDSMLYADYSGDSRNVGTTSLEAPLPGDDRSNSERYVVQTYRDVLGRLPEPSGFQYWTTTLDAGTPRTAVAHALAISTEHRERFVTRLFADHLDRAVDLPGRDSFVADLNRGATMNQVRASVLGSEEYFLRFGAGTVDGYIDALYREVLGRAADPAGQAFWRGELARGVSKPTMASALLSSSEALRRLVDARFQELLRRSVDPAARAYWSGLLQRGFREERLIAELIGSDEYYARALAGTYS